MAAERKAAQKVLNKVIDAGYRSEKAVLSMTTQEIIDLPGISIPEVGMILEMQKAIKANRVVTYLAGEEAGAADGK